MQLLLFHIHTCDSPMKDGYHVDGYDEQVLAEHMINVLVEISLCGSWRVV